MSRCRVRPGAMRRLSSVSRDRDVSCDGRVHAAAHRRIVPRRRAARGVSAGTDTVSRADQRGGGAAFLPSRRRRGWACHVPACKTPWR